jgi:hypothetical protein
MKLPQVRFTVQRMMLTVALFAILLGVVRLLQQRAYHLGIAVHNARWEAIYSTTELGWEERLASLRGMLKPGDPAASLQIAEAQQAIKDASSMKALFTERRRISDRLASRPWESAPPDPPDRKADREDPILIFKTASGSSYEFSTRSIPVLILAPIASLLAYVAFGLVRKRVG